LPFYSFSVTPEIQVRYHDGSMKLYKSKTQTAAEYNEKRSPSETAIPMVFNFELSDGLKDEIETIKANVEFQAGEKRKVAITHGERKFVDLNEWRREIVNIMSCMTEEELKNWDEDRKQIILGQGKIEKSFDEIN